jgi:hypothetical protein
MSWMAKQAYTILNVTVNFEDLEWNHLLTYQNLMGLEKWSLFEAA